MRFGRRVALAAGVIFGALCAPAAAAPGDLTMMNCFAETAVAGCTVPSQAALLGASTATVSPDGTSVYVLGDNGISHFQRAADGSLDFRGCIADNAGSGCTVPPARELAGPVDVEVSPDGKSVYVVAETDQAITEFARAPNGSLTFEGCWAQDNGEGCAVPFGGPALSSARGLAISPDGKSVYVSSYFDGAITEFTRDDTGELGYKRCYSAQALPLCTVVGTLAGAWQLAISPDGVSLYAVTVTSPAFIAQFSRAPSGELAHVACISDGGDRGCTPAAPTPLNGLFSIVLSSDGTSVYVVNRSGSAIIGFRRSAGGFLAQNTCVADAALAGCTVPPLPALSDPFSIAISPDGNSLYAVSLGDDAVTHLARSSGGELSFQSCLSDSGGGGCPTAAPAALGDPAGVAVSPDGASAYVTSGLDHAVSFLRREPPATTPPGGGDPADPDTTAPDTAAGKGPKRKVKTRKRRARVSFEFSASEPATTFTCQLDAKPETACSSPATARVKAKYKAKKHTFSVASTDAAGNTDQTPIVFQFKVKRKP